MDLTNLNKDDINNFLNNESFTTVKPMYERMPITNKCNSTIHIGPMDQSDNKFSVFVPAMGYPLRQIVLDLSILPCDVHEAVISGQVREVIADVIISERFEWDVVDRNNVRPWLTFRNWKLEREEL